MINSTQTFLVVAIIFFSGIIITYTLVDYENEIEALKSNTVEQQCTIDSLTSVIDTLNYRLKTFDIKYQFKQFKNEIDEIINAIVFVESADNDSAYRACEDAVGAFQIRRVMVDDVNRILKRKNIQTVYTYEDRWDRVKSTEMFKIFCSYYGLETAEEMARCWNGGPRGINNPYTLGYWNKVELKLEEAYASR